MSVESYAHKAAKSVVMQWLANAEDHMGDIYASCLNTAWFADDFGEHFWQEYPVLTDGTGLNPDWRFHRGYRPGAVPDLEVLKGEGLWPEYIFDVAVADCGYIRTGIEIVHKNPPSQKKLAFLKKNHLTELLILPARWVLGQIAPPEDVPGEFWAWR
jgi:hypothetical protein